MSGLVQVPSQHTDSVWMRILPHLLKGKEHWEQFYFADDIRNNLANGRQQLWIMLEGETNVIGCVLGQVDAFPTQTSLRIFFLGGTGFKRNMFDEIKKIENWARQKNVTLIDFLGRDEWYPLLKEIGYVSPGRVYRKELK